MAANGMRKSTERRFEVISGSENAPGGLETTHSSVIDVGACLSRINHRLFRQGRQYKVRVQANTESFSDSTSPIDVYALAPTWWVNAAWRKAKAAYDAAMSDEKKVLNEANLAKWRDFRVGSGIDYFALDAVELGGAYPWLRAMPAYTNHAPVATAYTQGEFNLATAKNLDTASTMSFTWGAASASKFSLIEEYTRTRNESASPETVITQMPYEQLNAEGEDLDYQELQANGNEPPYAALGFEGAIWTKVGTLSPGDLGSKTTGYFTAPCGIVVLRNGYTSTNLPPNAPPEPLGLVSMEVAEGDYHGVTAPAM